MASGSYRDRMPTRVIYLEVAHHEHDAEFGRHDHWKEWRCAAAICADYSGGRIIAQRSHATTSQDSLWLWIERQCRSRRPVWLVARDLGSALTLSDLWARINPAGYRLRRVIMSEPPTVFTVAMGRGVLQCVDLENYLGTASVSVLDATASTAPMNEIGRDDAIGWQEWCLEKCQSLCRCFTSIMSFVSRYGVAVWSVSLAGIAWRIWRIWYATQRTRRVGGAQYRALERQSYYPGECVAFRVGDLSGAWTHCDVNSLYPWAMLHGYFPVSPIDEDDHGDVNDLRARVCDGTCAARVCVRSEDVPFLVRYKSGTHRTIGKFWTVLCGAELHFALTTGRVLAVQEWVHYRAEPLFIGWVTDLYASRLRAREKGDCATASVIKLLMNSLAGKWAQKTHEWIDRTDLYPPRPYGIFPSYDYNTGQYSCYRAIAGHVQQRTKQADWVHSRPLIAGCITAYGRERMRQLRELAGDGSVIYQDTDSLILRHAAWDRLVRMGEKSDTRLGGLRHMGDYDGAIIYGPKRYSLGGKITVAGIDRAQAISVDHTYQRSTQQSLATLLLDEPQRYVGFSRRLVKLRDLPTSAMVGDDGTVLPLTMWED